MWLLFIPAALGAVTVLACSAPEDRKLARPEVARATAFPQRDLLLEPLGLLRVRYVDVGPSSGEPDATILLIPGHTSRIEEYEGLIPILADRFRVLAMDFPGSGYAEKPEREYDLAFYEDAAIALLDGLGVQRAHLAGGSLGGNLVLRLAHRFPERFERLAAWAPGSAWEASPGTAWVLRQVASYPLFWPIVRVQSTYWYGEGWSGREAALEDTFAYYDEVMSPGFVDMYFGMAADQVERSLFDLAGTIGQPVWLGWGDQDDGADMGDGVARLHALLPHSELRVYPGARHSLAAEVPKDLGADIRDFFLRPQADLPWASGR